MARIRSIKPEFWTSEQIVSLKIETRLFFIGLWNQCDDGGVHPDRAKVLKMRIFPGDDFSEGDIVAMVQQLEEQGLVKRFEGYDGAPYLYVTGWEKHQKLDRPNYKYPQFDERSTNARRTLAEQSPPEGSGVEWSGVDRSGKEGRGSNAPAHEEDFFEKDHDHAEPTLTAVPGGAAAAFEEIHTRLLEHLRPNGWAHLLALTQKAQYNPAQHGPVADEVEAFVRHNLGDEKKRARLLRDPIGHFELHFPTWLKNAKQFNRPTKTVTGKSAKQPAPRAKPRTIEEARQIANARHGDFAADLTEDQLRSAFTAATDMDNFFVLLAHKVSRNTSNAKRFARTGPIELNKAI